MAESGHGGEKKVCSTKTDPLWTYEQDWKFCEAIRNGDTSIVHEFIDAGTDVNRKYFSKTPSIAAVQSNNEDIVKLLIDAAADVNTIIDLQTEVVQCNNEGIVQILIDAGADVNRTLDGKTPLVVAVQCNNESIVKLLIDAGADVNPTKYHDKTPLIEAIQSNNESIVKLLIDAGANVNVLNYTRHNSVLFYAIQCQSNESVVRVLIDAGADLNTTDNEGNTALFYAIRHWSNESVVHALIDAVADVNLTDKEGKTALFYTLQHDGERDREIIFDLLNHGADINHTDKKGKTALFDAVKNYGFNCLDALVKAGADVNATDIRGKTALFYAVQCEKDENPDKSMVKKLIDIGADINIKDQAGETVLFHVVQNCIFSESSVASLLIDAGIDVNIKAEYGTTALMLACKDELFSGQFVKDNEIMVQTLIDAGADVNATDYQGYTALMWAVAFNNKRVVHKLIEAGADVNIGDKEENQTALFCAFQLMFNKCLEDAVDKGVTDVYIYPLDDKEESIVTRTEIVQLLIEKGNADVNARDVYGRTPLFYAISKSIPLSSYLIGKGANLMVKDSYNLSILSILIEKCIVYDHYHPLYPSSPLDMDKGLDVFLQHGVKRHAIFDAIINIVFCKTLGISLINSTPRCNKISCLYNILKVASEYLTKSCGKKMKLKKKKIIDNILSLVSKKSITDENFYESLVPKILPLLIELGANPNSVDFYGNTALHYATRLSSYGLAQETVLNSCHLLEHFGASFNIKNLLNQTPLLFCCDPFDQPERYDLEGFKILVDVCGFLLDHGSSVEDTTRDGKSVFHYVLRFLYYDTDMRKEIMKLLELFCQKKLIKNQLIINKRDDCLNSPLHLWASLRVMSIHDYDLEGRYTFEKQLLGRSFKLLMQCGAKVNDANENDETPLHLCKTWTAVNLLLDAGANPKATDSEGRSPLISAAKRKASYPGLYADFLAIDSKGFWKTALRKGLDLWVVDKHGESLLSVLVKHKDLKLARALVEVACDGNHLQSDTISASLLIAICRDESTDTQWKSILVDMILKSGKSPFSGKANEVPPLNACCRNIVRSSRTSSSLKDGVHWTIARQLLRYGADYSIADADGETCLDIAEVCPELKDLLVKPIDDDEFPIVIPWTSVSKLHYCKLAKVARKRECRHFETYWYHQDHLASGSFGAVFAGMNEKDGREVAIKRIEKRHMPRPEDKREITNLTALADCEQIVRYLSYFQDADFSYVVLELMEGNLEEFLDHTITVEVKENLCQDTVKGLTYLHNQNILHRDLKPANILFKTHPKICLKIADFGLSRRVDSTSTTVYGTNAGTRCWIAPEVLKSTTDHTKSSDVFACGLVLYYTLSVKRHPFAPADCARKSVFQINIETETNIIKDKMEGWGNYLCPEADELIKSMLDGDEGKRPGADKALEHPFFWPKEKKLDLLVAVGNQPEVECPRAKRTLPLTAVEIDLEAHFTTIVKHGNWNDRGYVHMPAIYTEMTTKRKSYDTRSVVELVRFIRNAHAHVSDRTRSTPIRKQLLEDLVLLEYFPNLVMEVYKAVTTHGWDQTREEIKYALKK